MSAHRTPERLYASPKSARRRGFQGDHRRRRRGRALARHDRRDDQPAGDWRADRIAKRCEGSTRCFDRADAGRRSGRHAGHRPGRRGQRRPAGGRNLGARGSGWRTASMPGGWRQTDARRRGGRRMGAMSAPGRARTRQLRSAFSAAASSAACWQWRRRRRLTRTSIRPDPNLPAFDVGGASTSRGATTIEWRSTASPAAVDVVTYEFENVPAETATLLARRPVLPDPKSCDNQDRLPGKEFRRRPRHSDRPLCAWTDADELQPPSPSAGRRSSRPAGRLRRQRAGRLIDAGITQSLTAPGEVIWRTSPLYSRSASSPFERELSVVAGA